LSQLLIKVSPRSSVGESAKTPLSPRCSIGDKLDKLSPVSSGFCSGEEADLSPLSHPVKTNVTNPSVSPIYEPVPEDRPLDVDSPGLEWDDGGCELGHSAATLGDDDEEILQQIQNFENSIFRQDLDTGEMRCYQHNTRLVDKKIFHNFENILIILEELHDETR